jgi:hypothetical protein
MAVGIASTYLEFEFYEFEPPEDPNEPQIFTINNDKTVDLDLSGDAIFRKDVDIKGDLIVQNIDILQEIQTIKTYLGI